MKNILFIIIFLKATLGFSQSFEANRNFVRVPRYANQAAINTAIPTPTEGMLVYDSALDQYAFFNGTAWTNFPSASGPVGTSIGVPTYANLAAINAIASPAVGWLVYNTDLGQLMIRTSTGWTTLSKGWVQTASDRLSYVNGSVTIGDATSTLPGKLILTRTSNNSSFQTFSSFGVYRYSDANASIYQSMNYDGTPRLSPLQFRHQAGSATPTPMMSIFRNGDLHLEGFAKIGGSAADVPAIRNKLMTGTLSSSSLTSSIPHGITDPNKIISINLIIENSGIFSGHNSFFQTSVWNSLHVEAGNVLFRSSTSSNSGRLFKLYITYIE